MPSSSVGMFAHRTPTVLDLATLADHHRVVRIRELHHVVIENLPVILSAANLPAAHSLRFYGQHLLDPIADIHVVDMLLDNMVAADPGEVIPVADLIHHLALIRLAGPHPQVSHVPINAGK